MKNFSVKRYLLVILALLFCITDFSACSKSVETFQPNKFTFDDLSIYDTVSKKHISYGMTKAEIEKILGVSSESLVKNVYSYDNGSCTITYRADKAVLISICSKEKTNSKLVSYRQIKIGDKHAKATQKYGDSTTSVPAIITYSFKKDNSNLVKLNETEMKNIKSGSEDMYIINFTKDKDDTIKAITIGDSKAVVYFE